MLALSVIFLVLIIVDTGVDLDRSAADATEFGLIAIWAVFAVELIVLTVLAPSYRQLLREHWLDVLIVAAPFLRPLRIARLLRLLRFVGIGGRAVQALGRIASRRGVQAYGAVTVVVVAVSGLLVYVFEDAHPDRNIGSVTDGLWWALVTATTVGYGDHFPVSVEGRALAAVLMLVGIGMLSVVTANVAAFMVESDSESEMVELRSQLDRIEALLVQSFPDTERGVRHPVLGNAAEADGSVTR